MSEPRTEAGRRVEDMIETLIVTIRSLNGAEFPEVVDDVMDKWRNRIVAIEREAAARCADEDHLGQITQLGEMVDEARREAEDPKQHGPGDGCGALIWAHLEAEPRFNEEMKQARTQIAEGRGVSYRAVKNDE